MDWSKEIWVPLVLSGQQTNYAISNFARVKRTAPAQGTKCGILKQSQNKQTKYFMVSLRINGKTKKSTVHRLVCIAFHGEKIGLEATHKDGSRTNNVPSNLCWATHKENMADKLIHGTHVFGERHGNSKLSSMQIKEIMNLVKTKTKRAEIAKKYGVHRSYVNALARGEWRQHDYAMA
jgi:predicted XRE-type DNA-binding protein